MAESPPLPEVEVRSLSRPALVKPVLVCGLPGSGYVGKLAADYLVTAFKAEKVAEFQSSSFPPHVNVTDEGLASRLRADLLYAKTGQENDLLIFTADAQPATSEGEYALADAVLGHAKELHAELVFSLAAFVTGTFVRQRHVFGASTSADLVPRLSENGVAMMNEGGISGMNGLVVGMAKLHGMQGVSLLGETSGYLLDPSASHSVLEALSKILGLKIDLASIEARAKEAQQIFSQVRRMTEQGVEDAAGTREEGRPGYIG